MSTTTVCPICRKQAREAFRPFCSQRCADVDLGRWLTEQYSTPARDEDDEETGESAP